MTTFEANFWEMRLGYRPGILPAAVGTNYDLNRKWENNDEVQKEIEVGLRVAQEIIF